MSELVSTEVDEIIATMVTAYEKIVGVTVRPASPQRLFIAWAANFIILERVQINYAADQNIPSKAVGTNLDALNELFYELPRPSASSAVSTMRFYITAVQTSPMLIAQGIRVTDTSGTLVWRTTIDAYVAPGDLSADIPVQCETPGTAGNGYAAGQINTLVDVFPYYDHCENITESAAGHDAATDKEYYDLMRSSLDSYSTAGAEGGYIFFAKQVSSDIIDVVANSPSAGEVRIYALMDDGQIAPEEIKKAILAACSDKTVRPLTDKVALDDPEVVPYNLDLTYYIPSDAPESASSMRVAVENTVAEYNNWQHAKLGRDINPSKLTDMLMDTGIKRVEIREPLFTPLRDGADHTVPQVATVGMINITDGGYEDE